MVRQACKRGAPLRELVQLGRSPRGQALLL